MSAAFFTLSINSAWLFRTTLLTSSPDEFGVEDRLYWFNRFLSARKATSSSYRSLMSESRMATIQNRFESLPQNRSSIVMSFIREAQRRWSMRRKKPRLSLVSVTSSCSILSVRWMVCRAARKLSMLFPKRNTVCVCNGVHMDYYYACKV